MSKTCQKVLQDLYDNAKINSEKIAIVDENGKRKTTNKEFITYINSAAFYLKKIGIKKGDIVALELGRTMEHFAIRMACNAIGAVWFSVNIDYPEDRKIAMYNICKPKLIFQEKNLKEIEIAEYPCQINYEVEDHEPGIIVFTSGTTGVPKGILHDRTSYFAGSLIIKTFGFNLVGAYAIVADLMFAVSIGDMYQIYGKYTCHIVDNETRKDPVKLRKYFIDNSIKSTVIFPSLLKLILPIESLSLAHIVGEKSTYDFSDVNTIVINNYACSEILTIACEYLGKDKGFGRMLPYCKIALIDENGEEIKKGDTSKSGEISYTGFIAAIKYLGGEENKKSEVVIENGETMILRTLRTGDRGRYNEDGTIKVFGRVDTVVKIRGNRVDIAEVEYNILKQENIFEAAVKCYKKGNEDYLCAYYTTYNGKEINEEIIKENLKKVVPEYMVPAFFVYKEKFEKNVHGKIDRDKLLEPKIENKKYISPKNEVEKEIIEIIRETMKIKKVGIEDSLKNMGISSLSAIQIQLEIENRLGVNIVASRLMNLDTIKEIAKEIKEQKNEKNIEKEIVSEKEKLIKKYYPIKNMAKEMFANCMAMQKYNEINKTNLTSYHMAFIIEFQNMTIIEIRELIKRILDTHPMLKSSIEVKDGVPCFVRREDWYPNMEETILDKKPNKKFFKTLYKKFELPGNELFKVEILKYGNKHYVFIDTHHLLVDGFSLSLIIRNIKNILLNKEVLNESISCFEIIDRIEKNEKIKDNYSDELLKNRKFLDLAPDKEPDGNLPIYGKIKMPIFIPKMKRICSKLKVNNSTIFATALMKALSEYLNLKEVCLPTFNYGRRDEDAIRTVGCLYEAIPVVYEKIDQAKFEDEIVIIEKQYAESLKHHYDYGKVETVRGDIFFNFIAEYGINFMGGKIKITDSVNIEIAPPPDNKYANTPVSFEIIRLIGDLYIINIKYNASKYNRRNILNIGKKMKSILIKELRNID